MPTTKSQQPALAAKKRPTQQRATETYEKILDVAARTLEEVGVERLSTNLVCERAGLTPPALYRYFPNKYALLCELGRRLMTSQNARVGQWLTLDVYRGTRTDLTHALEGLIIDTYQVTRDTVGGVWIMRAMRAVPAMQEVRLASHAAVSSGSADLLREALPHANPDQILLLSQIAVELIYSTVELLFDGPFDVREVARNVAEMMAYHLHRVGANVTTST